MVYRSGTMVVSASPPGAGTVPGWGSQGHIFPNFCGTSFENIAGHADIVLRLSNAYYISIYYVYMCICRYAVTLLAVHLAERAKWACVPDSEEHSQDITSCAVMCVYQL